MACYQLLSISHSQSLGFKEASCPILDVLIIRLHCQKIMIDTPQEEDHLDFNYLIPHVRSKIINTCITTIIYCFTMAISPTIALSSTVCFLSKRSFAVATQEVL